VLENPTAKVVGFSFFDKTACLSIFRGYFIPRT
jgi:hypothetical protein